MTKILAPLAAALLLSAGLAQAEGLVPGSDTNIRAQQSVADQSVANGTARADAGASTVFGYAGETGATRRSSGTVPGSDTNVRERQSQEDHAIATGAYGSRGSANGVYGYASQEPARASDAANNRATDRAAGVRTISRSALVPGSDSF